MNFGFGQTNKPTPNRINVMFDFYTGVLSVISGYVSTASWVPHSISDIISSIVSGLVVPILLYTKRLFGVEVDNIKIPTTSATVVDEDKIDKKS